MYYIIYAEDHPNSLEKRKATRPAHLERMQPLVDAGRVLAAGPCPVEDSSTPTDAGFSGSVIIAEFDSLQAAKEWADDDPYVQFGDTNRMIRESDCIGAVVNGKCHGSTINGDFDNKTCRGTMTAIAYGCGGKTQTDSPRFEQS